MHKLEKAFLGTPGRLSLLSVQFLISAEIVISGL